MRLGRSVLKGPVTDAGLLPAKVYRHLVLEAMEAEDFPGALDYLQWAADPLLAQLLVLRLRLLAARHAKQRQAILELRKAASGTGLRPVNDTGWKPALLSVFSRSRMAWRCLACRAANRRSRSTRSWASKGSAAHWR